jgi:glycosyltransferase involved in cell wall biosynthesis
VRNRFSFLGKKLRILYLGVDASFFDDTVMRQEEKFVGVIFSGEFRRGKNQEKLIEAVARYMKEKDRANFRLYLPGQGAALEACRKTAHRLGIAESVVFPGQVDRIGMLELYGKCRIAVVPSNAETFGFCIAEPMVLGLVVVSRPVGVALDVISHGRNGFIYRSESELIGLLKMLADDPDRRKRIGRTAADDSRVFQWGTICGQYLDALDIERLQYEDLSAGDSCAANVPAGIGSDRVAYFVSSYKVGLTITLSECAKSLAKVAPGRFEFISGDREQFSGLHEHLKGQGLLVHSIKGLDEHKHFFLLLKELAGLLRDMDPAIVHVHTNWQLALVALAKIRNRAKYRIYYSIHGYRHNHPVNAPIAKYLIGAAVALTCSRVFMASSYLMKEFSFWGRKRMLLFQGVESTFFQEVLPLKQEGTKRVVYAGQFRAGKGQEVVIKALDRYVRETGDTEVALLLPGEGPRRRSCEMLAQSLGIGPYVVFPGQLDRQAMLQLYRRCLIAVAPANIETFGYCIAEPFVLGRVVLSRPTGIALDIITDGESGFLFNNTEELAVLFRRLFSSPETLKAVGEKALESHQLLNWDMINRQYFDILREDIPGFSQIAC